MDLTPLPSPQIVLSVGVRGVNRVSLILTGLKESRKKDGRKYSMLLEPREQLTQEEREWGAYSKKLYALLWETREDDWTKWVLTKGTFVCFRQQGMGQAQCSGREKRLHAHGSLLGIP